jgi:hypothetical protein
MKTAINTKLSTVEIVDSRGMGSANLRVSPSVLGLNDQRPQGLSHRASVTESQLAKLRKLLPNGPKCLAVTERDCITGRAIAGEIYFDL